MGSRVKEDERNEKIIRGLLKLPGNRHREFSHRVKSISMARFTSQEVSALQEGGNERAKEIYFKHWDFQGPVIDSSDVDRLRTFIKNVYVERRYTNQRIGDHLPQPKVQGNQDSYGNSNTDSSRGVIRDAYGGIYEDNHDLKRSIESLSEDRNNSNGHPEGHTVDQNNSSTIAREKGNFGSQLRPDDLSKTGGKSENGQKVVIAPASSVVQASKVTNSSKVILPIKLPDPPRSQKATTNTSTEAQKPTSSRIEDAKLDVPKNLIDFDSDLEPPQGVIQNEIQKDSSLPPTDVEWATFDVANHGNQQHQHYFSPVNNIHSNNPLFNRATSAPVNRQLWRSASPAPTIQGGSILPNNQVSNISIKTRDPAIVSAPQQPAAEVTSNGRKALPEDIFTMSYRPVSPAWNWQPNPRVNIEYGHYSTCYPVRIVNTTQFAHPYPLNPVNLAGGPSSAHTSTRFPSLTSMQEALPNIGSTTLLSRAPDQHMVQQHAVQVQNNTFPTGYEGIRGIATTAITYGPPPMDRHFAAQNQQPMNHNSLTR
ncbi:hypothetical protein U9M48_044693, partial [Paspalum notatum var. saurae]